MWNEFPCSLTSAKAVWPGSTAPILPASLLCKGTSRGFQKFSKLSFCRDLCWWEEENLMSGLSWGWERGSGCWGSPWRGRVPQPEGFIQSTSGAGAFQGKALGPSPSWAQMPLGVVGCCNVVSQSKPANELRTWIPFLPLRKIPVPSYMFTWNRNIMIWRSFSLRLQNCSLMVSLPEHRNINYLAIYSLGK